MKFAYRDIAATHRMDDFQNSSVGMTSSAHTHDMTRWSLGELRKLT
jgi:hypothetical protein